MESVEPFKYGEITPVTYYLFIYKAIYTGYNSLHL